MVNLLVKMIIILILLLLVLKQGSCVFFNFTNFQPNTGAIRFERDAFASGGVVQLTTNQADAALNGSCGRASYDKEVPLWDRNTRRLTDFTTHFTFVIKRVNQWYPGDGMSFFIAPFNSTIPSNSSGGYLGLFAPKFAYDSSTSDPIVAVEFDTYPNIWDEVSHEHVGINVNSIISKKDSFWNMEDGRTANAWVSYNSTSQNLSVSLTYAENNPVSLGSCTLSYTIDLRLFLPEKVRVGFSASTGSWVEIHNILSWSFNSSLEFVSEDPTSSSEAPTPSSEAPTPGSERERKRKNRIEGKTRLIIGLAVGFVVIICGIGTLWFVFWRKRGGKKIAEKEKYDVSIDSELEKGAGPKRFTYKELRLATNNFAEEGKLGEGGFGGVYKGWLRESNTEVAVKRISKASSQGKEEYISEVKIISLLRHRNLVQLIGWCHKLGDFLLVYEYLSNGSLDSHLFGGKPVLPWAIRRKIALGLASALLYLHEEWEQCVVHRDIKSSNVMLDSNFNAKLGDFGLARLVDHEFTLQTAIAGTRAYMAPECLDTGKASKESDVYSFGVVALEICCGRRPVVTDVDEPNKVRLVGWVWELYGTGQLLEAVDKSLNMEFDVKQIECLMMVGLWCCHPDPNSRPTMKQVMNVLNFEAPLPSDLPKELTKANAFCPST